MVSKLQHEPATPKSSFTFGYFDFNASCASKKISTGCRNHFGKNSPENIKRMNFRGMLMSNLNLHVNRTLYLIELPAFTTFSA